MRHTFSIDCHFVFDTLISAFVIRATTVKHDLITSCEKNNFQNHSNWLEELLQNY